jgi:hypothetical protein
MKPTLTEIATAQTGKAIRRFLCEKGFYATATGNGYEWARPDGSKASIRVEGSGRETLCVAEISGPPMDKARSEISNARNRGSLCNALLPNTVPMPKFHS